MKKVEIVSSPPFPNLDEVVKYMQELYDTVGKDMHFDGMFLRSIISCQIVPYIYFTTPGFYKVVAVIEIEPTWLRERI